MADQTVRQDLVTYLRGVIDPSVQIYAAPPDVLKAPAISVSPSDPYAVPYDMGGPQAVLWGFDLVIVTSRAKVDASLAKLESLAADLWGALNGHPNTRWVAFSDIATTDIGDIPMLTGTLSVGIVQTITT